MLIVVSEPGNPDYDQEFRRQAKVWQQVAKEGSIKALTIGLDGGGDPSDRMADRVALEKAFEKLPKKGGDLWLVWIGHGSFDGRNANFNLRGGDIDAQSVAALVKPFERRLIILNLFSASAPFLDKLSAKNRVIISSTRSYEQRNYSRFGEYLADAIESTDSDMDLDGKVSLLEAVLEASARTEAFYLDAQRVVSENAVIEDNGDDVATPTGVFQGFRAEMESEESVPDGALTREIYFLDANPDPLQGDAKEERAELERQIQQLNRNKDRLTDDQYFELLEPLMLRMAELHGK